MNSKTLTALRGSIAKWEAIVAGTGEDKGPDNCPLCQMFLEQVQKPACSGCPVKEHTGFGSCTDTPYDTFTDAQNRIADLEFDISITPDADKQQTLQNKLATAKEHREAAAQAELDFLKSLLPEEAEDGVTR